MSGRSTGEVDVIVSTCHALMSMRDDASSLQLATQLVQRLGALDDRSTGRLLHRLETEFGPDRTDVEKALTDLDLDDPASVQRLHITSTSERIRLFEAINVAPGGTAAIVGLRAGSLRIGSADHPTTSTDLEMTLRRWFNRGFLTLDRIGWQTPASVLEKLIEYEAVHEIASWADLRRRLDRDRRCFGFFHPSLPGEPVIFVQVALTTGIPDSIQTLLSSPPPDPEIEADTATFYSISNCQDGLRGISFGSLLLKQVTESLRAELPQLTQFVTLSPIPGLRAWMDEHGIALDDPADLASLAARYLLGAKRDDEPADPVARFHLRNGASIERINVGADTSDRGTEQSFGAMVNYRYDRATMVANHEAYAHHGTVTASRQVESLL